MFLTYLRRELFGRRKQTAIIAAGMALAIGLVIIVNAFSQGVQSAQSKVLESVYGVGTDMTVTLTPVAPTAASGPQSFGFDRNSGTSASGTQKVSQSRLTGGMGGGQFMPSSDLTTVEQATGVKGAAGTLALQNITFSGQIPQAFQVPLPGTGTGGAGGGPFGQVPQPGTKLNRGGTNGNGGSSFNVDRFSVLGVDLAKTAVGPLSAITVSNGVGLTSADTGTYKAVLDSNYATSAKLSTGGSINIGGQDFSIVGLLTPSTSDSSSASDAYISLDVAQKLSGNTDKLSTVYVQANSNKDIANVKASLATVLTADTVKTQSDLASTVSGSLASASSLVSGLGYWLSIAVLIAAFLIAILFTISGVSRRTREFGTLKAIGWKNRRITAQVLGESFVQSMLGGLIGIGIGLVGIFAINRDNLTLQGSASAGSLFGGFGRRAAAGGANANGFPPVGDPANLPQGAFGGGGGSRQVATVQTITMHLPVALNVILLAVVLSIVGGLLAGAFGGWRASRLSPAAALRSVN